MKTKVQHLKLIKTSAIFLLFAVISGQAVCQVKAHAGYLSLNGKTLSKGNAIGANGNIKEFFGSVSV